MGKMTDYCLTPGEGYVFPQSIVKIDLNGGSIINARDIILKNGEVTRIFVPAGERSPEILLDFGKKVTGFIFMDIISCSLDTLSVHGDAVEYSYGPTVDSLLFGGEIELSGGCVDTAGCKSGDRHGYLLVDGKFLALRYMRIRLKSKSVVPTDTWLELKGIGIKFSACPVVYRGSFHCDNELLNKIWYAAAYTTQLCMQENKYSSCYLDPADLDKKRFLETWKSNYSRYVLWDAPRRDQELWVGDLRPEALAVYYAFGADEVVKSSIDLICQLQAADGLMPGNGTYRYKFIEYNFWWIIIVWEAYYYTGDLAFLKSVYPYYKSLMDWILYNAGDDGFIRVNKTWTWTLDRTEKPVEAQCVLYKALECAGKIEYTLGNSSNIKYYSEIAGKTKETINRDYWCEEKGVYFEYYCDEKEKTIIPSDSNIFAVLFGIAGEDRGQRVLKYLRENMWTEYGSATLDRHIDGPERIWPHNRQIWPFINAYEVEANFMTGNIKEAVELTERCWGNMLSKGSSTFWELVNIDDGTFSLKPFAPGYRHDCLNSACHAWSANILYLLQAYVLGIRPTAPAFKEVIIEPNPGVMSCVYGEVPTPLGTISACYKREEFVEVIVEKPDNMKVTINLESNIYSKCRVLINGKRVFENGCRIDLSEEIDIICRAKKGERE